MDLQGLDAFSMVTGQKWACSQSFFTGSRANLPQLSDFGLLSGKTKSHADRCIAQQVRTVLVSFAQVEHVTLMNFGAVFCVEKVSTQLSSMHAASAGASCLTL